MKMAWAGQVGLRQDDGTGDRTHRNLFLLLMCTVPLPAFLLIFETGWVAGQFLGAMRLPGLHPIHSYLGLIIQFSWVTNPPHDILCLLALHGMWHNISLCDFPCALNSSIPISIPTS